MSDTKADITPLEAFRRITARLDRLGIGESISIQRLNSHTWTREKGGWGAPRPRDIWDVTVIHSGAIPDVGRAPRLDQAVEQVLGGMGWREDDSSTAKRPRTPRRRADDGGNG